jgi:hypothetical protein
MHTRTPRKCVCAVCGVVDLRKGCTARYLCSSCRFEEVKKNRIHARQFFSGKESAGRDVALAISEGKIKRPSSYQCVDCGAQAGEYDHRDYSQPLDVAPVCRKCNHHRGLAIPREGYFTKMIEIGFPPYVTNRRVAKLFSELGIECDLSKYPARLSVNDWREIEPRIADRMRAIWSRSAAVQAA